MDHQPRWQFSLRLMLGLTAVVACTSAIVSTEPTWWSGLFLGFLTFAFPAALIMVVVYGHGYWRTFAIGALVPTLECSFVSVMAVLWAGIVTIAPNGPPQVTNIEFEALAGYFEGFAKLFHAAAAVYWTFAVVIGIFCVGVRWLLERGKARQAGRAMAAGPAATAS